MRLREIDKNKNYDKVIVFQKNVCLFLLLVLAVVAVIYYVIANYEVTDVKVEGNTHYTSKQIEDMVMTGKYGHNSLILSIKYKNKSITDVPFIERMDVAILNKNSIKITVYEKSLAGYVEYLGSYMYFDNKGKIVENASVRTSGIPQVTGLKFDYVVLHEPLPVENAEIFGDILSMTKLLSKYNLSADKIHFTDTKEMLLYFGNVRVKLGEQEKLDEEIMQLPYILPKLQGQKGILHLDEYRDDYKSITFEKDEE